MKRLPAVLLVAALALALFVAPPRAAAELEKLPDSIALDETPLTPDEERALATAVVERLAAAWNAGDAEAWVAEYWSDAEFINVLGAVLKGRKEILERHTAIFASFFKGSRIRMTVRVARGLGTSAILVQTDAEVRGFGRLPPGIRAQRDGVLRTRLSHVLLNREGHWRIYASQNTNVEPPPVRR